MITLPEFRRIVTQPGRCQALEQICLRHGRWNAFVQIPHYARALLIRRRREPGSLSAIEALAPAWDATVHFLFRPFDRKQWIALSLVCLFLGGGTSTAAFQWGFGALPIDVRASEVLFRLRFTLAQHTSLSVLAAVITLGVLLGLIYVRCVLRFVLIDAVVKQHIAVREAWTGLKGRGRSYFLWLSGIIGVLVGVAGAAVIGSIRLLGFFRAEGYPEWLFSLFLAIELVAIVAAGLLIAILITLTDDLVAPVIYAERISLPAAWKLIAGMARHDPGAFLLYVVVRFGLGMCISVAVLIVLFPALMGLSSVALLAATIVIVSIRLVGLPWVWNPMTYVVVALALGVFTSSIFALLSIVGMPGQVFLQDYGVRFMASRVQSLSDACVAPRPRRRQL
jgi:hypothetical protein